MTWHRRANQFLRNSMPKNTADGLGWEKTKTFRRGVRRDRMERRQILRWFSLLLSVRHSNILLREGLVQGCE